MVFVWKLVKLALSLANASKTKTN